jgi:hypothetical protein
MRRERSVGVASQRVGLAQWQTATAKAMSSPEGSEDQRRAATATAVVKRTVVVVVVAW